MLLGTRPHVDPAAVNAGPVMTGETPHVPSAKSRGTDVSKDLKTSHQILSRAPEIGGRLEGRKLKSYSIVRNGSEKDY